MMADTALRGPGPKVGFAINGPTPERGDEGVFKRGGTAVAGVEPRLAVRGPAGACRLDVRVVEAMAASTSTPTRFASALNLLREAMSFLI
jgi:hypothetical protein